MGSCEGLDVLGRIAREEFEVDLDAPRPLGKRDDSGEHRVDVVAGHDDGTDRHRVGISRLVKEGPGETGAVYLLHVTWNVDLNSILHFGPPSDA